MNNFGNILNFISNFVEIFYQDGQGKIQQVYSF